MFGAHLSVAGGLVHALEEAEQLGFDCVQVFTRNQRQWNVPPLAEGEVAAWWKKLRSLGWHVRRGPARVVSHNSYLINLASPDKAMSARSVARQRGEIERCEALGIRLLVAHPGAHLGPAPPVGTPHDLDAEPTRAETAGLKRIIRALDRVHRELPGYRTLTCLETTVGSGSNLGYAFHHLRMIRDGVKEPERLGICLDTCHVTAAGYDLTTDERAGAVLRTFESVCGRNVLKAVHMNDSVYPVGSRKDRHAPIGEGSCGRACFRSIVNHPRMGRVPKLLETPKGEGPSGRPWDLENIRRLKRTAKAVIRRPRGSR